MQHDIQVLDRVKSAYATLRPSEQRVADQVLADPEKCTGAPSQNWQIKYR